MSNFSAYLERQPPLLVLNHLPRTSNGSTLFVTIPCFDEPDLLRSLTSLANCEPPSAAVTIIVVVNSSDQTTSDVLKRNEQTISEVITWWHNHSSPFFQLRLLQAASLPVKWAGVGWARKIAMDEAIHCLHQSGKEEGVLISFDADSTVTTNYFKAIEATFAKNLRYNFVHLNFCHPIDDPLLTTSLREGITLYELYLRYLRNAMQWCGYPHAIHTVGSSFAVKASAYVKQGGMNRRKAGEDFHFLHKIVLLGAYGFVNDATVFPAARVSHRVPFGTGAALKKWEEGDPELSTCYSLDSFKALQPLMKDPALFYHTEIESWINRISDYDPFLQNYLARSGTFDQLNALKKNCGDVNSFTKRFYHLINAFWIIQYLNLCESKEEGKGVLEVEACKLLSELGLQTTCEKKTRELLEIYRQLDSI